ncbi:uncharacterized protein A4U43_C08F13490 [Asparagus officinalis]|nr:uncharacterized protein A4U43_C08F13490 [Asparagus officinalis]
MLDPYLMPLTTPKSRPGSCSSLVLNSPPASGWCAVDAARRSGSAFRCRGPNPADRPLDCRPLRGSSGRCPDWEEGLSCVPGMSSPSVARPGAPAEPTAHGPQALPCYARWRTACLKRESALQYALAHQQLEAVIQMEYKVTMNDPRYIRVSTRVDNIRLHVVRLGLGKDDDDDERDHLRAERHFPSRIKVWVGPEIGSSYTTGLSLGRSTYNPERESETTQTIKGNSATPKFPTLKARARTSVRTRWKSWRWEQEAEGSAA